MGRAQPCQRRYARQIRKCRHECLVQRIRRSGNYDQRRISTDQYSDGLVYIVPKAGYYYDYLNEPYLYKEWTPAHIGKAVFDEKHPSILGGMFAIWNDHVGNGISVKDIHHRIFSPLQTLSVKMWTGAQTGIPYETFNEKRALLSEAPGVNQLARIGKKPELVYERSTVLPAALPIIRKLAIITLSVSTLPEQKKVKEPNCSVRLTPYSICQTLFGG